MAAPRNNFTDEQIAELIGNKYVQKVGRKIVSFTDEFKIQFWRMYTEEDMLPYEILPKLGVDYRVLGQKRVQGITQGLKRRFGNESEIPACKPKRRSAQAPDRQISQLRAENEYLRQENEFIKKIISAGKERKR